MKKSGNKDSIAEAKALLERVLSVKTLALIEIVATGDIHALIDALSLGPDLKKQQLGALVLFASALNNSEMVRFLVEYNGSILWEDERHEKKDAYKEFYAELLGSKAYQEEYLQAFLAADKSEQKIYNHQRIYCINEYVLYTGLLCAPLMLAIANLNEELSRFLIKAGANLDYGNYQGQTCLLEAFENNLFSDHYRTKDVITLLIQLGADPNIHSFHVCGNNQYLMPPLFPALQLGDNEVVEILINAGANYELLRNQDGTITIRTDKSSFSVPKEKENLNMLLLKKYHSVVGHDNAISFLSQDSNKVIQRIDYIKEQVNQEVYTNLEESEKVAVDDLIELTALNLPEIVRFLIEDGLACQPSTRELLEGSKPNYFFTRLSTESDKEKMLCIVQRLMKEKIIDSAALLCEVFENEISEVTSQEEFDFGTDYISLKYFDSNINRLRLTMCAESYKRYIPKYIDITSLHNIPLPEELTDLVYSFLIPMDVLTVDSSCFSRIQRLEFIGRNYLEASRFLPKYNDQPRDSLLKKLESLDTDSPRSPDSLSITHLGSISPDSIAKTLLYALNVNVEAENFLEYAIETLNPISCPNTLKLMATEQFFMLIRCLLLDGLLKPSLTSSESASSNNNQHNLELLGKWKKYLSKLELKSPFVIPQNFEDVPRDGNCFYHALVKQLALHGRVYEATELRKLVLEYMANHIKESAYSHFLSSDQVPLNVQDLANAGNLEGAAEAYIAYQHSADNIWADELMVNLASNMLGIPIHVDTFNLHGHLISQLEYQPAVTSAETIPPLMIGNIANLHFISHNLEPSTDNPVLEESLAHEEPSSQASDFNQTIITTMQINPNEGGLMPNLTEPIDPTVIIGLLTPCSVGFTS